MEAKTNSRMTRSQNKQDLSEVLNGSSTDSTDNEEEVIERVKTYYLSYREMNKKFDIIISKRKNFYGKKYFACVSCDKDKDLIMEFENYFKYKVDNIKAFSDCNHTVYRTHNLTKDKLKQEMDKFIKSLGVGHHIDYFSTVNNWEDRIV